MRSTRDEGNDLNLFYNVQQKNIYVGQFLKSVLWFVGEVNRCRGRGWVAKKLPLEFSSYQIIFLMIFITPVFICSCSVARISVHIDPWQGNYTSDLGILGSSPALSEVCEYFAT